jgi:hypothetical protein
MGILTWIDKGVDKVIDTINKVGEPGKIGSGYGGEGAVQIARRPPKLKSDKESVLTAIKLHPKAVRFADSKWRGDKDVALAAVEQDGSLLQYMSEKMRNDREVALASVEQFGQAARFASEELRADKEVCMHAVRQDGWALQYTSVDMQADREVGLGARVPVDQMRLRNTFRVTMPVPFRSPERRCARPG